MNQVKQIKNPGFRKNSLSAAIAAALLASGQSAIAQDTRLNETRLEEVVVTATRRAETVADIPYNISAVSGQMIEMANIKTTGELLQGVPGAQVIDYGARNQATVNSIRIRGLAIDTNINMDVRLSAVPPVSTYINETPIFANMILKDLERVEVLRGPQGTLYGSGSLGGTVRYITRRPVLGEFQGQVGGSYSQTEGSDGGNWDADAVINIPLGENFAVRAVVGKIDYDGVIDLPNLYVLDSDGIPVAPDGVLADTAVYESVEDADTIDIDYARISALWQPNDRFDALLSYNYQDDDIGGRMQPTPGSDGWGDPYADDENGSIQREPSSRDLDITSLEMNIDLGFATLTSASSWYDHKGESNSENTGFYAQNGWLAAFYYNYPRPMASAVRTWEEDAFVQELRLVSATEGTFDWIIGAFYRDEDSLSTQYSYLRGFFNWAQEAFGCCVLNDNDFRYERDENFEDKALFGELTWNVSETFRLTGGFRYFDNDYFNDTFMGVGLYDSFAFDDQVQFSGSDSDTLFKLNASWDVGDDKLAYATISEGYRRGGANAVPLSGIFAEDPAWQTYGPDTTTNYEIGIKSGRGDTFYNISLFYVEWEDIQLNTATTNWGFFAAVNGGDAHTQGIEIEYDTWFADDWHLNFGYAYTDGELDDTFLSPDGAFVAGATGTMLPGLAEHTVNVMLENTYQMNNGWEWVNSATAYYQSEMENAISQSVRFAQELDGFSLWNLNSTFIRGPWHFGLFVKNLFDEEGVVGVFKEEYMGTDPSQNYFGNGSKELIARPRTIGLTFSYHF